MRVPTYVAVALLALSLWPAWRVYQDRRPVSDPGRFVSADAAARAALGEREGWLGVALSGYSDAVTASPDDLESLRGRIRTAFHIGGLAIDQPRMPELMAAQVEAYLARRAELDPDGSFLEEVLDGWCEARLGFEFDTPEGFYRRISTSIYLAARGDPRGLASIRELPRLDLFHLEFFPYVRRHHPSWSAVAPFVERFLTRGTLDARVNAGLTLLDYHTLFGVGQDLVDRFHADIRSAFREAKAALDAERGKRANVDMGKHALYGLALLSNLGHEEERRILDGMEPKRYPHHFAVIRVARVWAGLDPFERLRPGSQRWHDLFDDVVREHYFLAAWHHLARAREDRGTRPGGEQKLLELLESGFDGRNAMIRILALHALATHGEGLGERCIRRALDERGTISVYAAILSDDLDDKVPALLPALTSPAADLPALAAAGMLGGGEPRPLQ